MVQRGHKPSPPLLLHSGALTPPETPTHVEPRGLGQVLGSFLAAQPLVSSLQLLFSKKQRRNAADFKDRCSFCLSGQNPPSVSPLRQPRSGRALGAPTVSSTPAPSPHLQGVQSRAGAGTKLCSHQTLWLWRAAQDWMIFLGRGGTIRIKCQHQVWVRATHCVERSELAIRNIIFKMAFKGIPGLM